MINNKLNIEGFTCAVAPFEGSDTITYMIYPALEQLEYTWLKRMAELHRQNMVIVYVPAEKWNDALTPWPEPGEAKGCPPFAGKAEDFLKLLQEKIIPAAEKDLAISSAVVRNLMGVSLAGLFTLWQWLRCDTFSSIACLSGSFWYVGFIEWFRKQPIPSKSGNAFFLLGDEEPFSHVDAFRCVGENTEEVVERLSNSGIDTTFEWVPGNHFSRPIHRAERGLQSFNN